MATALSFPLLFIFPPTTPIFSHSFFFPIKLLLSCLRRPPSLSQWRERGPAAAIPCSWVAWRRRWGDGEFASRFYSPPLQISSHSNFFQWNHSSVGRTGRPPSINKGIKGPLLPYLPVNDATSSQQCEFVCACHPSPISDVFSQQPFSIKLLFHPGQLTHPQSTRQIRARCCYRMLASRVDRRVMVSFPVLFIFPPPFKTFSHSFFFQWNCYPVCNASGLPSVGKANKSLPLPFPCSHAAWRRQWPWVLLASLFSLPPLDTFSHRFFFQYNCHPIGCAGCPHSVNHGNKVPPPPSLPVSFGEKAVMVSIQLVFNFPPPLQFFSQGIFSVTLLFSGLRQLPSPSQSKEQGPATTISTRKVCGEGRGCKISSCFFFKCSLKAFFAVKCYLLAARFCCFLFSFPSFYNVFCSN